MPIAVRSSAFFAPPDPLGSTNTGTCDKPPGTVVGDLLVAGVARSQSGAATTGFTAPGWTVSTFHAGNASQGPSQVLTLPAGAAEPANYTFTSTTFTGTDNWEIMIVALTGADLVNPIAVAAASTDQGAAASAVDAPTLTIPAGLPDNALLLCLHYGIIYNATPNLYGFTPAAGMTEQEDQGSNWLNGALSYQSVGPGATGAKTATFVLKSSSAATTPQNPAWATSIAIRPALVPPPRRRGPNYRR